MHNKEFVSEYFRSSNDHEAGVREWQGRYNRLIGKLGINGSQVRTRRILERDREIPPHGFISGGLHEFVFPRQKIVPAKDNSTILELDTVMGCSRVLEDRVYDYDPNKVDGHLAVAYEDSDRQILFTVEDLVSGSALPNCVAAVLEEVFDIPILEPAD